ncbi:hypothetical protein LWE61_12385 [Sphingobium sufflavum]|uniref:hypothetical protein n=1 Tax=Sphingobium sufflavum TaxID=1129547 RepID=UPI001F291150|nr:hypothetical protein [Sphingobium sufflavum]MCE7797353.1 hypothetical protein [Sphingobium sufflavum]
MADWLFFVLLIMHWKLSKDFSSISEIDLRAHDALFDRLLHVHLQRNHLFCLSPSEVVALRRAIQFGPQALHVLSTILRRAQDYAASVGSATRHAVLMPLGSAVREPLGKEFYIKAEDASWWLEHPPSLYVENAVSDGGLYNFILSSGLRSLIGSPKYLMVRPFHGGGNPLGSVMEALFDERIQGICICDRDDACAVPPFPKDTTSEQAHVALHKMRVVDAQGQSEPRNPFFSFKITHGWGVENYIGPNVLNLFFNSHLEACTSRSAFLNAFPDFPALSETEANEWFSINFKSVTQDAENIERGLSGRFRIAADSTRCGLLAGLSIPKSVIPFVIASAKSGRHHHELLRAFDRDMRINIYRNAVRDLTQAAMDALAADTQMNFA